MLGFATLKYKYKGKRQDQSSKSSQTVTAL